MHNLDAQFGCTNEMQFRDANVMHNLDTQSGCNLVMHNQDAQMRCNFEMHNSDAQFRCNLVMHNLDAQFRCNLVMHNYPTTNAYKRLQMFIRKKNRALLRSKKSLGEIFHRCVGCNLN